MTAGNGALLPYQAEARDHSALPAGSRVTGNEIAWIHALHAVELCQRVAELAARREALGASAPCQGFDELRTGWRR
jgi:hypothetical protein